MGQLGNQLFIIAATTALAVENGADSLFPELARSTEYNIPNNYERLFGHLDASEPPRPVRSTYREPHFSYSPIPYTPDMEIVGYFQSEKYFKPQEGLIRALFAPPKEIRAYLTAKYGSLLKHPNTVAIHYRSYKKEDPRGNVYVHLDAGYYKRALDQFPEDALFVVFSNDMRACKKMLAKLGKKMRFIEGESYIDDFYLMSLCKHQVICNSSFSWWAAYLNENPGKTVVAPARWFNPHYIGDTQDLLPDTWLKV